MSTKLILGGVSKQTILIVAVDELDSWAAHQLGARFLVLRTDTPLHTGPV